MQPSAVTISAARQQSPNDDMRSIGDDENATARPGSAELLPSLRDLCVFTGLN
jgi:hypothetical protein